MAKSLFGELGGKYERQGDYLITCLPTAIFSISGSLCEAFALHSLTDGVGVDIIN